MPRVAVRSGTIASRSPSAPAAHERTNDDLQGPKGADILRNPSGLTAAHVQVMRRVYTDPTPTFHTDLADTATSAPLKAGPVLISGPGDPVLQASAPFHAVGVDVRKANKFEFEQRRDVLRRAYPQFDSVYADYRRWRDSAPHEAHKHAEAGKAAQIEMMKRSGVLDSNEAALYRLLVANSDLLRYVSPINGDFRAPAQGLIAGFRLSETPDGAVPTLVFPGTGSGSMIRSQMKTNIRQFLGHRRVPAAYELAVRLSSAIRASQGNRKSSSSLAFTGHSLGGAIASVAAAHAASPPDHAPRCYVFNPAGLGAAVMKSLRNLKDWEQRVKTQVIIRVKNDQVSSPAMQRRLAALCTVMTSRLVSVPQHLGRIHVVDRQMLAPAHRSLIRLHSLEALCSLYDQARRAAPRSAP